MTDRRAQAQILRLDETALLQDQRSLDGVIQLSHVARPLVLDQGLSRRRGETHRGMIHFLDVLAEQTFGERQNIGGSLAQRRQAKGNTDRR